MHMSLGNPRGDISLQHHCDHVMSTLLQEYTTPRFPWHECQRFRRLGEPRGHDVILAFNLTSSYPNHSAATLLSPQVPGALPPTCLYAGHSWDWAASGLFVRVTLIWVLPAFNDHHSSHLQEVTPGSLTSIDQFLPFASVAHSMIICSLARWMRLACLYRILALHVNKHSI